MKPAPFAYEAPWTLEGALNALDADSKALAGGQSLIPMLNFRLARPARIVDLGRIPELAYLRRTGGTLRIGAMTRQATLEKSAMVAEYWPLLGEAVRHVGHAATRSRGTVGGSVAHADPAAELPAALLALDARLHARSAARGPRVIPVADFFRGQLTTALEPDELLTEIEVPASASEARSCFVEHARTHGAFALAAAAVVVAPGERAAIALVGAAPTPIRAPEAERALSAGADAGKVAGLATQDIADGYRRALLGTLVRRALEETAG